MAPDTDVRIRFALRECYCEYKGGPTHDEHTVSHRTYYRHQEKCRKLGLQFTKPKQPEPSNKILLDPSISNQDSIPTVSRAGRRGTLHSYYDSEDSEDRDGFRDSGRSISYSQRSHSRVPSYNNMSRARSHSSNMSLSQSPGQSPSRPPSYIPPRLRRFRSSQSSASTLSSYPSNISSGSTNGDPDDPSSNSERDNSYSSDGLENMPYELRKFFETLEIDDLLYSRSELAKLSLTNY